MPLLRRAAKSNAAESRSRPIVDQVDGSIEIGIADFTAGTSVSAAVSPAVAMAHAAETVRVVRASLASSRHGYGDEDLREALKQTIAFAQEAGLLAQQIDTMLLQMATTRTLPEEAMARNDGRTIWRLVPLDSSTKGAVPVSEIPGPAVVLGKEAVFGWERPLVVPDGVMVRLDRCTIVTPDGVEPYPADLSQRRGCWARGVTHVIDGAEE